MKMIRLTFLLTGLLLLIASATHASDPVLIPQPVSVKALNGSFTLSDKTVLYYSNSSIRTDAVVFNEFLQKFYGFSCKIVPASSAKKSNSIVLNGNAVVSPEGSYKLLISPESIDINGDASGVFYALQTLKQLIPPSKQISYEIPCYEIEDYPRYSWRGMHLDVARHFFPKEFVKKYIDFLASYKMNTFHWHLTDDQGWRIEIKKYPELTKVGAYRNGTLIGAYRDYPHEFDNKRYGGFYTQEEIKEVVAYAAARHVTIVPEIEMPGHSRAALASYPQYSCTGGPFEVGKLWGVEADVFCPKDETFSFLEDVLTEVMALFPGKYIHIGGDEVPKERWKDCDRCQALMKKENLKSEEELQSYFIHRIEKFVNAKGRTIIGWDEILEGGLAPNAAVMSWRGPEGGIAAARQGHNVVMTPGGYCYFDHYQGNPASEPVAIGGYTSVEKVYSFDPTPKDLSQEQKNYILGAQANLWTEYIASTEHVEYMIFPRICALAEVVWSPNLNRNYEEFKNRLITHFSYLDFMGINYSKALFELKMKMEKDEEGKGVRVNLSSDFPNTDIYYTLDGSTPGPNAKKVEGSVLISQTCELQAGLFQNNVLKGKIFKQQYVINKASGKNISLTTGPSPNYNNGGAFTLVDGIFGMIPWYGKEWLGFSGTDMEAVVDLGKTESVWRVTVDVLNDENSWIHLPKSVHVAVSADGKTFTDMKTITRDDIMDMGRNMVLQFEAVEARYVKVKAVNRGKIPEGSNGAGQPAWLFVDEIGVE